MQRWTTAIVADLVAVLAFAIIGRASHHEGVTPSGVWHTAWPFALGTVLAVALTALRRQDPRTFRAGVSSWLWTVVIGMVVRQGIGEGTAAAFVVVAAVFFALTMLGWRLANRRR